MALLEKTPQSQAGPEAGVQASPAFVSALRRMLRPLIRLLLTQQITYPYLAGLLKRIYVETAEEEFVIDGRRQTTSRVSLLTGIHRKDVRRLREDTTPADVAPPNVSLGAQLVGRWIASDRYCGPDQHPIPLPRVAASGEPSFEELVASVSKDIRARSVLDEWMRLGIVEIDSRERIRLRVEAFVPGAGFDEKAYYFGRNLHDHVAAASANLEGKGAPLLERSVYYGDLSADSVLELETLAEKLGMDALQKVNRRALELREKEGGRGPLRMSFGVFFFRAADEAEPDAEEPRDD